MTDEAIRLGIADRLEQAMRGGWGSVRIFETDEQAQLAIDILRAIPQEPVAPTIIRELAQFFLDELELDRAGTEDWVAQGDLEVETFIAEAKRLCAGDTKSDGARSPHIPDTQEEANERGDIEGTGGRSYYRPSDTPFADEALRQLDADLAPLRSTSEPIAQGQREAIARIIDPTGFDPDNLAFEPFWIDQWKRRALAKADAILAALAPSAQEGETSPRTPKVRTSHHRNKEEAARLQALVNERLEASPHPRPMRGGGE